MKMLSFEHGSKFLRVTKSHMHYCYIARQFFLPNCKQLNGCTCMCSVLLGVVLHSVLSLAPFDNKLLSVLRQLARHYNCIQTVNIRRVIWWLCLKNHVLNFVVVFFFLAWLIFLQNKSFLGFTAVILLSLYPASLMH